MIKNRFVGAALAVVLLFCLAAAAGAQSLETEVANAMADLKLARGDGDLLVLTDAPYLRPGGRSALPELAVVEALTGCSVGTGNLLFFQRPQTHPLRVMLFSKTTGDAVILSVDGPSTVSESVNMSPRAIADPAFWKRTGALVAGKDLFTLAAVANAWAKGAPYDFLKSAELHNHICPGLTSGYLMARYILNTYPLKGTAHYTMIACPVWCKEDALQVMLDCTPGKRGMVVKPLSEKQLAAVAVKNPAGMLLIWDRESKKGTGVALSFDFDALRRLSPKGATKAAMVLDALAYLDKPETFVFTAATFPLTETLYNGLTEAGGNPYVLAGLVR
ncbi:MAG: FmdE family protein [Pseudomonadota bacterium]